MKIKSMMAVALAALCFTACSKSDDNIISQEDNQELVAGEETYALFSISLAKANSTRAFHGSTSPTAEEGAVKDLTVYIYDYYTDTIEEVLTFSDENDTKTVLITTGPKKFVATSGISPYFQKGQPTGVDINNTIIGVSNEAEFTSTLTVANEFWMTSDIVEHTVVSATKEEAETTGHHNNITMKLGRAMAKIGVVYDETIDITDDETTPTTLGHMSSVEYRIKNQPDQMYLFTGQDASGVWITPYYNRNNNLWASSHAANYWHQQSWHSTAIDGSSNHVDPTYMMENSNMTARYGNATYASIKGVFSPSTWYDQAGNPATSGSWNAGDDFWRIGYVDATSGEVTGFVDNKIYDDEPDASLYANDGTEAPVKYEGGVMYYWIYLNSSLGQTYPTNTADKYSQHRNHYWDVDIQKVTGLGWNEEDGGRPDDPNPLDEQSYIHATIEILDWEEVYMPGELTGNN